MTGIRGPAIFLQERMINRAARSFDDFAGGNTSEQRNRRILGLAD